MQQVVLEGAQSPPPACPPLPPAGLRATPPLHRPLPLPLLTAGGEGSRCHLRPRCSGEAHPGPVHPGEAKDRDGDTASGLRQRLVHICKLLQCQNESQTGEHECENNYHRIVWE